MNTKAQSQAKTKAAKRTTTRRAASRCALCAKLTEWKPAVRKTIDEARRFADRLDSGELTRESLVENGELMTADAFARRCRRLKKFQFNVTKGGGAVQQRESV